MNGFQAVFILFLAGFMSVMIYFLINIMNLKLKKLRREEASETENTDVDELKKQMGYLMAENEELREDMRNLKYLMGEEKTKIDPISYEKEQILIDQQNKLKK